MKKLLIIAAFLAANTYVRAQQELLPSEARTVGKERLNTDIKLKKVQTSPFRKVSPTLKNTVRLNENALIKKESLAKELGGGSSIYIVELEDGTKVKRMKMPSTKSEQKSIVNQKSRLKAQPQIPVVTFSESFEGWDGEMFDWIPGSWVDESKTGMNPTKEQNLTWYTSAGVRDYPSDGVFMAHINIGLIDNGVETIEQDEWLITPQIKIAEDNRLQFDLCFKPGWVLLNPKTLTFNAENTTLKILITNDDGNTWKELWNATDEAKTFTYKELLADLQTIYGTWIRKQVDLSEYANQDVKIAFRFVGTNGESMSLDNLIISPPMPEPLYHRPSGAFFMGFSENYSALTNSFILSPAYEDATWYNFSSLDSKSFVWSVPDPETGKIVESTDTNLVTNYPYVSSNLPILTGYTEGNKYTSSYQWGTINQDLIQYGGSTGFNLGDGTSIEMGAGNYDIYNMFDIGYVDEDSYVFGSNSDKFWGNYYKVDGIANLFEKPLRKYAFDKMWIHCLNFDGDPDVELKLYIYKVDTSTGVIQDMIATSTCYGADVATHFTADGFAYNSIPFTFKEIDPATGRERLTWLEIDDAIFVEVFGFNSKKVRSFAPCYQALPHPTFDNYAYIYLSYGGGAGNLYSVNTLIPSLYTSFLFNMNAVYPFMLTEDSNYNAPVDGGTKEFVITSYYDSDSWRMNDLPEWITVGKTYINSSNDVILPVTVNPLSGSKGRSHDIKISSYASDVTLKITQGEMSGIEQLNVEDVKVAYNGNSYKLTYPAGIDRVSVVNTAGQIVASYELPVGGSYVMPATNLNKGVYILKFEGSKNRMVKVMR
ncbi:choice-of-anchor J domain-containing protein [Dysgonomonas sp. 520]|uniref:choice-of-anchor J domain-containing protein n=1 Tax=Dysgonomonas sp. 520 TaxID=2302931 RepID=UPI0013D5199D|nr:choice-of-anchor J domain-containing protein [Dysgonomonas sp. 520]NDW10162.1 hypothetical protein [Dysgonomonas sp. 520]